jgi:DNA replication protein DnaC
MESNQTQKRIREEYTTRYLRSQAAADARREEVHLAVPEIEQIDREMQGLGLAIMGAATSGGNVEEKVRAVRERNEALQETRRRLLVENGYPADYTEVRYECPVCGDTGYVDCKMCVCLRRALTEARMQDSGMAPLMHKQSFDNFSLDYYKNPVHRATMTRIYTIMREYAESFSPGTSGNLALFGGTGLGKTHLSTAVASTVIKKGYDVYYTGAVSMLSDFEENRFGYGVDGDGERRDTTRYYECSLLIIDDLGTEVYNQFTASVLYNVINTRLNRSLPTVISTNLDMAEFRRRYWDRITSRVLGEYRVLPFEGEDVRSGKLKK